jgi:hypothetical protein
MPVKRRDVLRTERHDISRALQVHAQLGLPAITRQGHRDEGTLGQLLMMALLSMMAPLRGAPSGSPDITFGISRLDAQSAPCLFPAVTARQRCSWTYSLS